MSDQNQIFLLAKQLTAKLTTKALSKSPFTQMMLQLSKEPLKYEDNDLLDLAMGKIPVDQIYQEAEKNVEKDNSWSEQDYVIQALVKWFKQDFFMWVNSPVCDFCGGETDGIGAAQPSPEEARDGASRVEMYKCKECSGIVRFPRYGSLRKLLVTRKGRCGEFANCFTLLCRAMGSRARWVWNREDHVWTEVYSDKQKRWVHFDPSEGIFDKPLVYSDGWGKKMSYVIGFSNEGAMDVTKRYVRNPEKQLPRKECKESELSIALQGIRNMRRKELGLTPKEIEELVEESKAEQSELDGYVKKNEPTRTDSSVGPRESGAGEWTKSRGEDGATK